MSWSTCFRYLKNIKRTQLHINMVTSLNPLPRGHLSKIPILTYARLISYENRNVMNGHDWLSGLMHTYIRMAWTVEVANLKVYNKWAQVLFFTGNTVAIEVLCSSIHWGWTWTGSDRISLWFSSRKFYSWYWVNWDTCVEIFGWKYASKSGLW